MQTTTQGDQQTMADRLKALRSVVGVSLRQVDRVAGVAQCRSSRIISGERDRIQLATACAYAEVFGVTLDWLVYGRGSRPGNRTIREAFYQARRARDAREERPVMLAS